MEGVDMIILLIVAIWYLNAEPEFHQMTFINGAQCEQEKQVVQDALLRDPTVEKFMTQCLEITNPNDREHA